MHYQKGKDREQVFMTNMENWVSDDSWARVVDLFVDAMPVREFGFRHAELNKEGNIPYDRREGYEEIQKAIDESEDGQVSMTDPDARAVIRRRNIVEVGYNLHATVVAKHKMIVDVFANGVNDTYALSEAGRRAQEITGKQNIDMIADKGYNNGIEIARAERMRVRPFVSPREKRRQTQEGFAKSDFHYDQKADTYHCPAGEELRANGRIYHNNTKGKGKSSYCFKRYTNDACSTCTMRAACTQSVNGRVIDRPTHQAYVDRNDARVRRYPEVYQLRQELVEHPFGTMKRHWGMDFTYQRGSPKVVAEYSLATICFNLMRMVSVKCIAWVEKCLKRLFFAAFGALSAHCTSRAQTHHVALWWMSVLFYVGFVKFTEGERVVA